MKKSTHSPREVFAYIIVTFVSNTVAVLLPLLIVSWLPKGQAMIQSKADFIFISVMFFGVNIALCTVAYNLFLKKTVPPHFNKDDSQNDCARKALILVLPGEILRMFVCHALFGSNLKYLFSPVYVFYENFSGIFLGHSSIYLEEHGTSFSDFMAFSFCYLAYFIINLAILLFLYQRCWKKAKFDREDMIVYEDSSSRKKLYK